MNNPGIIRNRLKIKAAVSNSIVFKEIQKEYGSFANYIWSFTDNKIVYEEFTERTTSPLSDTVSKDLKKRGMTFVGSTIIYSFGYFENKLEKKSYKRYNKKKNRAGYRWCLRAAECDLAVINCSMRNERAGRSTLDGHI